MASFNLSLVVLGGRLTQDPELRTTASGIPVCTFTVAVNRPQKDGESKADFINCVAWRSTAEFVTKYFRKASSICVQGTLQTRSYEGKDGQKRTVTEVQVDSAHFVDSKSEMVERTGFAPSSNAIPGGQPYIPDAYKVSPESVPKFSEIDDDEPLPF